MTTTREKILSRLRENTSQQYEMPNLAALDAIRYADPVAEFIVKTTTTAGARLVELTEGETVGDCVKRIAGTGIVASALEGIEAQMNPDTVGDVRELMTAEVGVVEGRIGVAENACIWIPQQMREKAILFAVQHLVIVLSRTAIVNNMNEAYALISDDDSFRGKYPFGTFISGPSKTADIEGALVYGAQAARALTVILT